MNYERAIGFHLRIYVNDTAAHLSSQKRFIHTKRAFCLFFFDIY